MSRYVIAALWTLGFLFLSFGCIYGTVRLIEGRFAWWYPFDALGVLFIPFYFRVMVWQKWAR